MNGHDPMAEAVRAEDVRAHGPKLLGVWDGPTGPGVWSHGELQQIAWWVQTRLTEHARDLRRVEFYMLDGPFAIVQCYKRNEDGFKYQDPATGEAAVEDPFIVPLRELPPAHLLRQP